MTRSTVGAGIAIAPKRAKRGVAMPTMRPCASTTAPPTAVGCRPTSRRREGAGGAQGVFGGDDCACAPDDSAGGAAGLRMDCDYVCRGAFGGLREGVGKFDEFG